jgi:hypothetical protein
MTNDVEHLFTYFFYYHIIVVLGTHGDICKSSYIIVAGHLIRRQRSGGLQFEANPSKIVCETLSQNNPITKNWAGGVAQGKGPVFKPQYHKNKNKHPTKFALVSGTLHLLAFFYM